MKKIAIIILLINLSSCVVAQSTHSEEIISFIDKSIGKKVGTGICADLVTYACRQWNKEWKFNRTERGLGMPVTFENLQPGDFILTTGEVDLDGTTIPSHIMIAYKVNPDETWQVAEQNAVCNTLAESKVIISEYDEQVWIDGSKRITIKYFRPQ